MNCFRLLIGNKVIEVRSPWHIYQYQSLYSKFSTEKPYDFYIELEKKDMESFTEYLQRDSPFESIIYAKVRASSFLRKTANGLLNYDTILLHGASIIHKKKAYLFTAPSGTGKTTHVQKWKSNSAETEILNGDKLFISFDAGNNYPTAYSSPWAGKEIIYTNTSAPLKAIICMERAEDNSIQEITFAEAFPFLLQQTYRPEDEDKMRKTLHLLQQLDKKVKLYRFYCNNFKANCFDVAFNALVKDYS